MLNQPKYSQTEGSVKSRVDIRFVNVPPIQGNIVVKNLRDIRQSQVGKLIITFGTVMRTSNVVSRELRKKFECKQCGFQVVCESDITEFNQFKMPQRCGGKVEKKDNPFFKIAHKLMNKNKNKDQQEQPRMQNCWGRSFIPIDDAEVSEFGDYQEIKLQELFKTLQPGLIPRSICVILENKLTESVKPGDDVMLTGVLVNRWRNFPPQPGQRPVVDLALIANNVEVLNKRELQNGDQITKDALEDFKRFWKRNDNIQGSKILVESVCPSIFERSELKLGVLLALIGGVC